MPHQLRITFVLPHLTDVPIGGYKGVYEFSNEMVHRGHTVNVVLPKQMVARTGAVGELKNIIWPRLHKMRNPAGITWFKIDPRVNVVYCSDLREKWIPDADFVFATSWRTAPIVANYSERLGRKMYLIQHLETFGGPFDEVVATWRLPLDKLVITKWLADFGESLGEKCTRIKVGIDMHQFGLDNPIEEREPCVAMMYSDSYVKGAWDGIHALELVKERFSHLRFLLFGVPARPDLPKWMEYFQNVPVSEIRSIYNSASIFVHTSWSEGWGAPPLEAMRCGAAIIAAGNLGVMDYLKPGETALIYRPKYWTELAAQVEQLLTDEELRCSLAKAGNLDAQHYSWESATDRLLEVLGELVGR